MKIVYLTSRLPFPPVDGRRSCLFYYCKYLAEMLGHEITVISFLDDPKYLAERPDFISSLHLLKHPPFIHRLWSVLRHSLFQRRSSLQGAMFWSPKLQRHVNALLEHEKPDVVISDMTRTGRFFMDLKIPKIINLDDLLSRRYERLLNLKGNHRQNLLGDYARNIPSQVRWLLTPFVQRILLSWEMRLLRREEIAMAVTYDASVLVSPEEARILESWVKAPLVRAIPMAVDVERFSGQEVPEEPHTISFLGLLSIAHNEHAVLHFHSEIFPLIKREFPGARFLVVGNKPTSAIQAIAKSDPGVEVTGWVENVQHYVKRSRVFVAPLLFGSGVKTKILEAMAMGVPVVATPIAAEGIGAQHGEEILIGETPEELAALVVRVLQDAALASHLRDAARRFVSMNYSPSANARRWEELLESLVQTCRIRGKSEVFLDCLEQKEVAGDELSTDAYGTPGEITSE